MIKNIRKKGFTEAEAVIALAVITIVTAAAMSIVASALSRSVRMRDEMTAQNFAFDLWECFKSSEDHDAFCGNVEFSGVADLKTLLQSDADGYSVYTYEGKKNAFTATVRIKCEAGIS